MSTSIRHLTRVLRSRLPRLNRPSKEAGEDRRRAQKLHAATDEILEAYRSGRITRDELREWLQENDPAQHLAGDLGRS